MKLTVCYGQFLMRHARGKYRISEHVEGCGIRAGGAQ